MIGDRMTMGVQEQLEVKENETRKGRDKGSGAF